MQEEDNKSLATLILKAVSELDVFHTLNNLSGLYHMKCHEKC